MAKNNNIRRYRKDHCISFRSTKAAYGGLSNMAGGYPIKIQNIEVRTSEALYQALKYPFNCDIQKKIIDVRSPIFAKNISRKYNNIARRDWQSIQYKVMRFCIEVKLIQNYEDFSQVLISTGDLPIVEFTKKDKVWGAVDKGYYFEGVNALGRLLMEVREKIKDKPGNYDITRPDINNLILFNVDLKEYFFPCIDFTAPMNLKTNYM